jgi:cytochrome c-type biogenesis protein CcmH
VSRLGPRLLAIVMMAAIGVALAVAARTGPPTTDQRTHRLTSELRCPVCQGLSVADSPSSTSTAIAADVHRRVVAGQSDDQIRSYYVARYGRWILLSPGGGAGLVAWALPIALIAGASLAIGLALRHWSHRVARTPTAAELALVRQTRQRTASPSAGSHP